MPETEFLPFSLPDGITLRVWSLSADSEPSLVFESSGRWLHPLFELTEFLQAHPAIPPEFLMLRDKVIGRAAAFLILALRIRNIRTDVVSRRALTLFSRDAVSVAADQIVDRIACQTEDLLADISDFDQAWTILNDRRNRALSKL